MPEVPGYLVGGEPFELPGGPAGVLLLHGFSGSAAEIRELGGTLAREGFGVVAPLLAGHGTTPNDLFGIGAEKFLQEAQAAYESAARRFARTYVVGLSLGGTLGLHIAANCPVAGLVTISTPVFMSRVIVAAIRTAGALMPKTNVVSNYAAWRGEVVGYRRTPLAALTVFLQVLEAAKRGLPHVVCPILIVQSTADRTVPPSNASFILKRVSSTRKQVYIYQGGRHLLTMPPHLAQVVPRIIAFLKAQEERAR